MKDANILLWSKAAREKEICNKLCLRILFNLMIPMQVCQIHCACISYVSYASHDDIVFLI